MQSLGKARQVSSREGRVIRVLVANRKEYRALSFPESEVSAIQETGQNRSALILQSGLEIPVALPYEELEQKIYMPDFRTDGAVLDLRAVTGAAALPVAPA